MITVTANGKLRDLADAMTVSRFLELNNIDPKRVAVLLGDRVLKREEFDASMVEDGSRIEVVSMVGGG